MFTRLGVLAQPYACGSTPRYCYLFGMELDPLGATTVFSKGGKPGIMTHFGTSRCVVNGYGSRVRPDGGTRTIVAMSTGQFNKQQGCTFSVW